MGHIDDHFSHAELVRELQIEAPYEHAGLIAPDAFWTKAVTSFESDKHEFLRLHACPLLDRVLKHDHLVGPATSPHCVLGDPTSTAIVGRTCDPPAPHAIPEPSPMVLSSIAIVAVAIFCRILKSALAKIEPKA